MSSKKQAILFLVVHLGQWGGLHVGAWRDTPETSGLFDFSQIADTVRAAEEAKLHGVFLADGLAFPGGWSHEALSRTSEAAFYDPLTVLAALSSSTARIGLVATANTTYHEPYHVARTFASLDRLSGGRAAWNVVTGTSDNEARNLGHDQHPPHAERYARAEEFYDVVAGLWDSWEDDAFVRDTTSGRYFDIEKMHVLDHRGKHFSVAGPLTVPRSVQGRPVIAQAGSSPDGLRLAARIGEMIFTHQDQMEAAQKFYRTVKDQVAGSGRDPAHAVVMPARIVLLGRSQDEAEERLARLNDRTDIQVALARLAFLVGYDLSGHPLDGPVPDIPETVTGSRTMRAAFVERARRDDLSVRQFARLACGIGTMAISAEAFCDHVDDWVSNGAADGFGLSFADAESFALFVELVVPQLQNRGLFRLDYEGQTLRENLGLPRPRNRYA